MMFSTLVSRPNLATRFLFVLLLGGCGVTFDYSDIREMKFTGKDFDAALGREYRELALFEADEMWDWRHATQYREKTLSAAGGNPPAPEKPGAWRLPPEKVGAITAASVRLDAVLERDARGAMPSTAARAQSRLDCWLEQQEENWQPDHIARCRDGFFAALMALEGSLVIGAAVESPATPAALESGPQSDMASDRTETYAVFFDFDSAALLPDIDATVQSVIRAMKGGKSVRIVVGGHTDRAGSGAYNLALSKRRADAVRRALLERGAPAERITINAHGEDRPRVATPDGVREPRNRRVEIIVGPAPAL